LFGEASLAFELFIDIGNDLGSLTPAAQHEFRAVTAVFDDLFRLRAQPVFTVNDGIVIGTDIAQPENRSDAVGPDLGRSANHCSRGIHDGSPEEIVGTDSALDLVPQRPIGILAAARSGSVKHLDLWAEERGLRFRGHDGGRNHRECDRRLEHPANEGAPITVMHWLNLEVCASPPMRSCTHG
jgi:hypothetical protein